jgi:hypothetical protein
MGETYATASGQGPGNYLFDNTQVVRISQSDCVYGKLINGTLCDPSGKPIPMSSAAGKVVMLPGEGAEHKVMYMDPSGKLKTSVPNSVLERWAPSEGKFVPVDPTGRP